MSAFTKGPRPMLDVRRIRLIVVIAVLVMTTSACETVEPVRGTPAIMERRPPPPVSPVAQPRPAPPVENPVGAPAVPRHVPVEAKTDTTESSRAGPIVRPDAPSGGEGRIKLDRERPTSDSRPTTPTGTRAARAIREARDR